MTDRRGTCPNCGYQTRAKVEEETSCYIYGQDCPTCRGNLLFIPQIRERLRLGERIGIFENPHRVAEQASVALGWWLGRGYETEGIADADLIRVYKAEGLGLPGPTASR